MFLSSSFKEYPAFSPTENDCLCDWSEFYFYALLCMIYNHKLQTKHFFSSTQVIDPQGQQASGELQVFQKRSQRIKQLGQMRTNVSKVTFGEPTVLVTSSGETTSSLLNQILVPVHIAGQVKVPAQRPFMSSLLTDAFIDKKADISRFTYAMRTEIQTCRRSFPEGQQLTHEVLFQKLLCYLSLTVDSSPMKRL